MNPNGLAAKLRQALTSLCMSELAHLGVCASAFSQVQPTAACCTRGAAERAGLAIETCVNRAETGKGYVPLGGR